MQKQRIPILTTSALGFIAICIVMIGAWDMHLLKTLLAHFDQDARKVATL